MNGRTIETEINFDGAFLLLKARYFPEDDEWGVEVWPSRSAPHSRTAHSLYYERTRDVFATFAGCLEVAAAELVSRLENSANVNTTRDPGLAQSCRAEARDYRAAFNL